MRYLKALLLLVILPSLALAQTAVLGPAANPPDRTLYDYRNTLSYQDDFMFGAATSGSVGMGWNTAGTVTASVSSGSNIGIINLSTTAVISTIARLHNYGANHVAAAQDWSSTFIVKLLTNDANTTVRYGLSDGWGTNPPTAGIYFEKLDGDTNWFCVNRVSGVETGTHIDSGVAVTTSFVKFQINRTRGGSSFLINGVSVCSSPMTGNLPTGAIGQGVFLINSAASAKTVDIDYLDLTVTGMSR